MILDAASTVVDFPARTLFSVRREILQKSRYYQEGPESRKIRLIIGMYTYCCEISYGRDELAINY